MRLLLAALPLVLWCVPAEAGPLAGVVAGVALSALGGASLISIAINLAGSFVLSALSRALAKKPKNQGFTAGLQDMVRQPITARRTIYGLRKVSGPLVYLQTYGAIDGLPNIYLSMLVALAGHECEDIDQVFFNDQRCRFLQDGVTVGSPFSTRAAASDPEGGADTILAASGIDFAHVYKHLGASNQAADSRLVADSGGKWTTAHRLRGICYLHTRLRFDRLESLFHDGAPTVTARVKGKKVYDTRTATTAWSNNPALCLYDYLTDVLGIDAADIDTASVDAAANVCEENVTLASGATQDRYTCNATIDADDSPVDVLNALLSTMAGALVYAGGQFYVYAGAATAASLALDESNLMGPVTVWPRTTRRETFNGVKAVYVNSTTWQPVTAPVVDSATYIAQDNGEAITQTIDLPFTASSKSAPAQRLAKIELERARQQIVVDVTTDLGALQLTAWDTVTLSIARYGWSSKKFRVIAWRLNEDAATVSMTLREEADSMWSWAATEEEIEEEAPDTTLPSPFDVQAPGTVTVTEDLRETNGNVVVVLEIVAGEVGDGFLDGYACQVRRTLPTATQWRSLGEGTSNEFEFSPALDGATYEIRVRASNAIGARSAWTTVTHQVAGQTTPPEDVANFRVDVRGAEAWLAWDAVADLDLSHYRVRWSPATSGATWASAVDLVARVARPATSVTVATLAGTYLIKAVDLKGNESVNATLIVSTVAGVAGLNVEATLTESPSFAGTHSDTVAVDSTLKLGTSNLFDSAAGNFDDMNGLFDGGGGTGNVVPSGTYTFANALDLGAVYTSRVTASLTVTAEDYASVFDDAPGNFDDREGLFDGAIAGDVNARLEVRTTLDDPAGAPDWGSGWRPFAVGDFRARAFQFRTILTTANANASPVVSALSVTIDMPDRVVEEHDVASGAGAKVITFPGGAFRASPAIGVSAQGLATGDFYEITSKTVAGFTITFKNSGGTAVNRTFDYLAKGYGRAA